MIWEKLENWTLSNYSNYAKDLLKLLDNLMEIKFIFRKIDFDVESNKNEILNY